MSSEPQATADGPVRRRDSWSLKTIVEEVAGRPISELQDPSRPMHPYLKIKLNSSAPAPRSISVYPRVETPGGGPEELDDPVARVYPPLVGATGRALHGEENAHHAETLASVHPPHEAPVPGVVHHPPGPSRRPERIYLHYLLLHLDRLTDPALSYLHHAVREEIEHRELARRTAEVPAPPTTAPAP
ncbi:MAG: hypothetical protein L3K23_08500 [Thermoplasmata archaeon]|nr:hypothetical protein [Thermoplasmata archaeon]